MPFPYQIEESLLESIIEYVWIRAIDKPYMLELLAPLVIGSNESVTWFIKNNRL